jgi:hypothetical protein
MELLEERERRWLTSRRFACLDIRNMFDRESGVM